MLSIECQINNPKFSHTYLKEDVDSTVLPNMPSAAIVAVNAEVRLLMAEVEVGQSLAR